MSHDSRDLLFIASHCSLRVAMLRIHSISGKDVAQLTAEEFAALTLGVLRISWHPWNTTVPSFEQTPKPQRRREMFPAGSDYHEAMKPPSPVPALEYFREAAPTLTPKGAISPVVRRFRVPQPKQAESLCHPSCSEVNPVVP